MLRVGHAVVLCALALLTTGVVMVNSAGMRVQAVASAGDHPVGITAKGLLLSSTTAHMMVALLAMFVAARLPVRRLADVASGFRPVNPIPVLALVCGALIAVLLLSYAPFIGRNINGSHRWIGFSPNGDPKHDLIRAQPSEVVKWALVGVMAWYGTMRAAAMPSFWRGLLPGLAALGVVSAVVAVEDLGTGVLIAASASVVLLGAGARFWHFLMLIPLGIAGVIGAILKSPYRVERIMSFVDPYAEPQGSGYHMIQSMVAIANGGGPGRGLGFGLQKMGFLPEDKTDFLFAVICEELGIAGASFVVFMLMMLLWSLLVVMRRERSPILKLFVLGVTVTLGLQAVINLFVVTGLGPTKGIALPLVSSGGTGWLFTAFCLGLVIAVDRTREPAAEMDPGPEGRATLATA